MSYIPVAQYRPLLQSSERCQCKPHLESSRPRPRLKQEVNLSLRLSDSSDAQLPQNVNTTTTSSTGLEASPIQTSENTSAGMQELLTEVDIHTQQHISQHENNRSGYFREHIHDINN